MSFRQTNLRETLNKSFWHLKGYKRWPESSHFLKTLDSSRRRPGSRRSDELFLIQSFLSSTNLQSCTRAWIAALIKHTQIITLLVFLCVSISSIEPALAQQQSGCFTGKDLDGYTVNAFVSVEQYGDWFQIYGQIYSAAENILYKFSADGHSGAGRMYQNHEYEAGAMYIDISNLTEQGFELNIDSYGSVSLQRTECR